MAYVPLDNISNFPNWIFLPKIVPLAYDDTLSYYEFLCKVLVKLNELIDFCDQLNLNVEELKSAVDTLTTLVNGFDTRITAVEGDVQTLNTAVASINDAIATINGTLDSLQAQIYDEERYRIAGDAAVRDDLTSALNTYAASINTQVQNLTNIVNDITPTLESYDARITALEEATIGTLTPASVNRIFSADFRHLDTVEYEIVDEVTDGENPSIYIGDNIGGWSTAPSLTSSFSLVRFKSSGDASHLIIKNVLPYYYSRKGNGGEGFALSALLWNGTGVQYFEIAPLYTVQQAMDGVQTSGGSTGSTNHRLFADFKLELNQESGNYDLHIFNGRNTYVSTNNLALMALFVTDTVKTNAEMLSLWNCNGLQAKNIAKNVTASVLAESKAYTDAKTVEAKSYADSAAQSAATGAVATAEDFAIGLRDALSDGIDADMAQTNSYELQGQDNTSGGASSTLAGVFDFDPGVTHNVYKNTRILECSGLHYQDTSVTPPVDYIDPRIMILNIALSASDLTFNSNTWTKICAIDLADLFEEPDDDYIKPLAGRALALTGTQYLSGSMSSNNSVQFRVYNNSGTIELQARYFGENRTGIQVFVNGIVVFDYVNT